jgi:hypothetical protein
MVLDAGAAILVVCVVTGRCARDEVDQNYKGESQQSTDEGARRALIPRYSSKCTASGARTKLGSDVHGRTG